MAKITITENILENIATAIRTKAGTENLMRPAEMPAAINAIETGGYPEPTGTINITQNGTENVKDYAAANVNVPNSYSASDEGKVVDDGALVAQGSQTITQNGTYDTTLIAELIANISGGGGTINILSGAEEPTASQGEDGEIYLQYFDNNRLPAGYTAVQFLRSNGNQYINTNIVPTGDTQVEIEYEINSTVSGSDSVDVVCGSRTGSTSSKRFYPVGLNGNLTTHRGVIGTYVVSFSQTGKSNVLFNDSNHKYYVDGVEKGSFSSTSSFSTNNPIGLFATMDTSGASFKSAASIYSCKITDTSTDETLGEFYPCKRDSDDALGMYDLVTDTFFQNEGSGSFECSTIASDDIVAVYCKVNGAWQNLIGSDIDDVNTGD